MIGSTLPPGASGVSIAGTEVWKPESLSAPAGKAASAATTTPVAAAASKFLVMCLPRGLLAAAILRGLGQEEQIEHQLRVAAHASRFASAALLELECPRVGERPQALFPQEHLVDTAKSPAVRGVDGDSERRRLAVHRPAGRDDQVGESDQALRVDGAVGDDQRRELEAPDVVPLFGAPREHDRVHVALAPEVREQAREERV